MEEAYPSDRPICGFVTFRLQPPDFLGIRLPALERKVRKYLSLYAMLTQLLSLYAMLAVSVCDADPKLLPLPWPLWFCTYEMPKYYPTTSVRFQVNGLGKCPFS